MNTKSLSRAHGFIGQSVNKNHPPIAFLQWDGEEGDVQIDLRFHEHLSWIERMDFLNDVIGLLTKEYAALLQDEHRTLVGKNGGTNG